MSANRQVPGRGSYNLAGRWRPSPTGGTFREIRASSSFKGQTGRYSSWEGSCDEPVRAFPMLINPQAGCIKKQGFRVLGAWGGSFRVLFRGVLGVPRPGLLLVVKPPDMRLESLSWEHVQSMQRCKCKDPAPCCKSDGEVVKSWASGRSWHFSYRNRAGNSLPLEDPND